VPALLVAIHVTGAIAVMWSATRLLLDLSKAENLNVTRTSHDDLLSISRSCT
jgi:hypothetical protein